MPPVVNRSANTNPQEQGPSVTQQLLMGGAIGGAVGMTMGFLLGGYSVVRYGAGPQGPLPTLAKYMLTSGATFGLFMAIGGVIRADDDGRPLPSESRQRLALRYAYPQNKQQDN